MMAGIEGRYSRRSLRFPRHLRVRRKHQTAGIVGLSFQRLPCHPSQAGSLLRYTNLSHSWGYDACRSSKWRPEGRAPNSQPATILLQVPVRLTSCPIIYTTNTTIILYCELYIIINKLTPGYRVTRSHGVAGYQLLPHSLYYTGIAHTLLYYTILRKSTSSRSTHSHSLLDSSSAVNIAIKPRHHSTHTRATSRSK